MSKPVFEVVVCQQCGRVYRKRKATSTPCPTSHLH